MSWMMEAAEGLLQVSPPSFKTWRELFHMLIFMTWNISPSVKVFIIQAWNILALLSCNRSCSHTANQWPKYLQYANVQETAKAPQSLLYPYVPNKNRVPKNCLFGFFSRIKQQSKVIFQILEGNSNFLREIEWTRYSLNVFESEKYF